MQQNRYQMCIRDSYIVETLRVLAFDKTTKDIVTNVRYTASEGDIIRLSLIHI